MFADDTKLFRTPNSGTDIEEIQADTDKLGNWSEKWFLTLSYIVFGMAQSEPSSGVKGCWLVGCFGFTGPLRQYFSLNQAVSQREGERGEKG